MSMTQTNKNTNFEWQCQGVKDHNTVINIHLYVCAHLHMHVKVGIVTVIKVMTILELNLSNFLFNDKLIPFMRQNIAPHIRNIWFICDVLPPCLFVEYLSMKIRSRVWGSSFMRHYNAWLAQRWWRRSIICTLCDKQGSWMM
jgi:hypothetical protein